MKALQMVFLVAIAALAMPALADVYIDEDFSEDGVLPGTLVNDSFGTDEGGAATPGLGTVTIEGGTLRMNGFVEGNSHAKVIANPDTVSSGLQA